MMFITTAVAYIQRETGSGAACWHLDVIGGHLAMPCHRKKRPRCTLLSGNKKAQGTIHMEGKKKGFIKKKS